MRGAGSSGSEGSRASSEPILLYDGTCGLCAASVRFVLRHERQHALRFAALQSQLGEAVRARHSELAGVDSMVWVEATGSGEQVLTRSTAALRVARYVGGPWRALALAAILPRPIRDALYDFIARHRHRIVRTREQCYLPPPAVRARFLS
jgi:predicted DCC family thiol-disulfide oxidoreductase YuxK